jgi:hypothetical protein
MGLCQADREAGIRWVDTNLVILFADQAARSRPEVIPRLRELIVLHFRRQDLAILPQHGGGKTEE